MRSLRLALPLSALFFASCSFIVGGTFKECENDTQCASDRVCLKGQTGGAVGYCIPMPPLCRREAGDFAGPDHVVLAAALPLTAGVPDAGGTLDDSEVGGLNALKLALDEVNVRTIDGRKLALYVCDTYRDAPTTNAQVTWLADELGAKAIFFSGSGQGIEAHKVASTRNVLLMSATATSPELVNVHQTSGLLWRTAPPDTLQGRVLADFIQADATFATVSNVSVVYVDDAYGQGLKSVIQTLLPAARYTVRAIPYTEGEDLAPVVNALDLQAPHLTVLIAFRAEAKEILRLARGKTRLLASNGHKWMFTDSAKDPAILEGGALSEVQNSYGFAPAQGAGSAYPSFRDSFTLKYSVDPSQYSFLSHAYDAMYVVSLAHAYALGAGGGTVDGLKLAEGIQKLSSGNPFRLEPTNVTGMLNAMKAGTSINIEGSSGKLDFVPDAGAPPSPIERWQIMPDGGFETKGLTEPPLNL